MTRGRWFVVGIVFLAFGIAVFGFSRTNSIARSAGTPAAVPTESLVTAKGNIVPAQHARLSFQMAGSVAQVRAKEGSRVRAGDVLAQLDTGDLKLQLQAAQDALDIAAASLQHLKTPGSPNEIAAAKATLANAKAAYEKTKKGCL